MAAAEGSVLTLEDRWWGEVVVPGPLPLPPAAPDPGAPEAPEEDMEVGRALAERAWEGGGVEKVPEGEATRATMPSTRLPDTVGWMRGMGEPTTLPDRQLHTTNDWCTSVATASRNLPQGEKHSELKP